VTLTRRGLLRTLLLATGVDQVLPLGPVRRRVLAAAAAPAVAVAPPGGAALAPADLEDLVAFAEVLVEGRPLSPDERRHLVDHIETRVRLNAWYLTLYRATVGFVNQLAGARFSTLDIAQRVALMTRHRLTSVAVGPDEDLGQFPEQARDVRTRAVPDLIGGYYGSAVGWAVVGYDTFPGTCGDLTRYTRAEP
jgi:hypothetical protein